MEATEAKGEDDKKDKKITISVGTPKGVLKAKFDLTDTVKYVIDYTVKKQHLDGGSDAFELYLRDGDQKTLLTPVEHTLASFGIKADVKCLLAATGSGV
jgi:hypothetical protein